MCRAGISVYTWYIPYLHEVQQSWQTKTHTGRCAARLAARGRRPMAQAPSLAEWQAAIKRCILFRGVAVKDSTFVMECSRLVVTFKGMAIYEEGDAPTNFYLVHSGEYEAAADQGSHKLNTYVALDNFGACELLANHGGRSCTVSTLSPGLVWAIPQRIVKMKLMNFPPLDNEIKTFCKSVKLFSTLPEDRLTLLCHGATRIDLAPGEQIFAEDEQADAIFALQHGTLRAKSGRGVDLQMYPPETFGESALMGRVRLATVTTEGAGATVLRWSVRALETMVGYLLRSSSGQDLSRKVLSQVSLMGKSLLSNLSTDNIEALLAVTTEEHYEADRTVVYEGEVDKALYIIKSGEAIVRTGASTENLCVLSRGECFGEASFLLAGATIKPAKRNASVVANTSLVLVVLSASALRQLKLDFDGLRSWADELIQRAVHQTHVTSGLDWVVADKQRQRTDHAESPERGQQRPAPTPNAKQQRALTVDTNAQQQQAHDAGVNGQRPKVLNTAAAAQKVTVSAAPGKGGSSRPGPRSTRGKPATGESARSATTN